MVKGIIPQVEKSVKPEFSLMEIVGHVEKAMLSRGWNKATLTEKSGASSPAVTRFFQDGKVRSDNIFKMLVALDMLNVPLSKSTATHDGDIDYHGSLDRILNSGVENAIGAVKFMLKSRLEQVESEVALKQRMDRLEKGQGKIASEMKEIRLCLQGLASSGTGTDGGPS